MASAGDGRPGLRALGTRLIENGVAVARAEVDLVRTRVALRLTAAKAGIVLIALAAVVALLAAIGLVVGITLALATLVGPGFAGLIVAGIGLGVAAVLGWAGSRKIAARPLAIETPR